MLKCAFMYKIYQNIPQLIVVIFLRIAQFVKITWIFPIHNASEKYQFESTNLQA